MYAKYPYKPKYQLLINKHDEVALKHFKDPKASIEYLSDVNNVYESIEEYNQGKKWKLLIEFDNMIADMITNKNLGPIVSELFIGDRKLNISFYSSPSSAGAETLAITDKKLYVPLVTLSN